MSFIEVLKIEFVNANGGHILGRFEWTDYDRGSFGKHIYSISEEALPLPAKYYKFFLQLCRQSNEPEEALKKFKTWHELQRFNLFCLGKEKAKQRKLEEIIDSLKKEEVDMKEVKS